MMSQKPDRHCTAATDRRALDVCIWCASDLTKWLFDIAAVYSLPWCCAYGQVVNSSVDLKLTYIASEEYLNMHDNPNQIISISISGVFKALSAGSVVSA